MTIGNDIWLMVSLLVRWEREERVRFPFGQDQLLNLVCVYGLYIVVAVVGDK